VDLAIFSYGDPNNITRALLRSYDYSSTSLPTNFYDPQQRNASGALIAWSPALATATWAGNPNLHAAYSGSSGAIANPIQRMLVSAGYDVGQNLGNIIIADMGNSYAQKIVYNFPTAFNTAIANAERDPLPTTGDWHGEGVYIQNVLNATTSALEHAYVYMLFNYNPNGGYQTYSESVVVKFELTVVGTAPNYVPILTFKDYKFVGKNSCSFVPFDSKLFICAIGGMQNPNSSNTATGIWYVDISNPVNSNMTVTQITVPTLAGVSGDFYDICFVDNKVYILAGHFINNYALFNGNLYLTSLSNLYSNAPTAWTLIDTISEPGNYWSLEGEPVPGRLWVIKGQQVEVYTTPPTASGVTPISFTVTQLAGSSGYTDINSATLLGPNGSPPATEDTESHHHRHHHKISHSHARLAMHARQSRIALTGDGGKGSGEKE
jgi:hypothetical protein